MLNPARRLPANWVGDRRCPVVPDTAGRLPTGPQLNKLLSSRESLAMRNARKRVPLPRLVRRAAFTESLGDVCCYGNRSPAHVRRRTVGLLFGKYGGAVPASLAKLSTRFHE